MNAEKKKQLYRRFALLLAFIMALSTLPMNTSALVVENSTTIPAVINRIAPSPHSTFAGNGFSVQVTNHSSWATGHNTMFEVTNTSSSTWYNWVFSMNRNMGLNIPTAWGDSWQNNGLFIHQDNSETTVRNLGHQNPVAPGQSVQIHMYSNTTPFHMPTDFRVRQAERRPIPVPDYTYQVLEHSYWQGVFFHHAIVWNNVASPGRIIQDWEIEFDIIGEMNIDNVPNAAVFQPSSNSAILSYIPGSGQVMHPGQNMHLGIFGTFIPGSQITNVRFYERIGTAYGGWQDWFPPGDGGGGNDNGGGNNGGGNNSGGNGGSNGSPGQPPETPTLTIISNENVRVYVVDVPFPLHIPRAVPAGTQKRLVVIPNRGFALSNSMATAGELTELTPFVHDFVMPSIDAEIHLAFRELERMPDVILDEVIAPQGRQPFIRPLNHERMVSSQIYDNYYFVQGEVLIYAQWIARYWEIEALVESLGGAIVGNLPSANMYQIYFAGMSEVALRVVMQTLMEHFLVDYAGFNLVLNIAMPEAISARDEQLSHTSQFSSLEFEQMLESDAFFATGIIPNDPNFSLQWGLPAINAPQAWALVEANRDRATSPPVPIGMLDTLFEVHDDLSTLTIIDDLVRFCSYVCLGQGVCIEECVHVCTIACVPIDPDVTSILTARSHGNMVAGIIGADADNGLDIAGLVWNSTLYGFALYSPPTPSSAFQNPLIELQYGLYRLYQHGVRIVNVSMSDHHHSSLEREFDIHYSGHHKYIASRDQMTRFLANQMGHHDFLIIQAAGNSSDNRYDHTMVDTLFTGLFTTIGVGMENFRDSSNPEDQQLYIASQALRNQIIVVGNMERHYPHPGYGLFRESQIGERVDIIAPGHLIFSLMNDNNTAMAGGTSAAAPHIAGIAGMMLDVNPYLTSAEIKDIILQTVVYEVLNPAPNNRHPVYLPHPNAEASVAEAIYRRHGEMFRPTPVIGNIHAIIDITASHDRYDTDLTGDVEIRIYCATTGNRMPLGGNTTNFINNRNEFTAALPQGEYVLQVLAEDMGMLTHLHHFMLGHAYAMDVTLSTGRNIRVTHNREYVTTSPLPFIMPEPFIVDNRVMIPLRAVMESMGYYVSWDTTTRTIHLRSDTIELIMHPDQIYYTKVFLSDPGETSQNWQERRRFIDDVFPQIINNRAFLPLRTMAYELGYHVEWEGSVSTAHINSRASAITTRRRMIVPYLEKEWTSYE